MGTWNETCMLSHLPILEGEEVGGVLLAQKNNSKRTSYPDEIWQPISPVIMGEYDGYGRVASIQERSDLEVCYRNMGKIGQIKFFAEGNEIPTEILTLKSLIEYAEHDSLSVQYFTPTYQRIRRVTLVLIRSDILQYVYEAQSGAFRKFVEFCDQGLPIEDPRSGRPVHNILKWLHENKICVADIKALDSFMLWMRMQWGPTSGAGSQLAVEEEWQSKYYHLVAETADRMLQKHKMMWSDTE